MVILLHNHRSDDRVSISYHGHIILWSSHTMVIAYWDHMIIASYDRMILYLPLDPYRVQASDELGSEIEGIEVRGRNYWTFKSNSKRKSGQRSQYHQSRAANIRKIELYFDVSTTFFMTLRDPHIDLWLDLHLNIHFDLQLDLYLMLSCRILWYEDV